MRSHSDDPRPYKCETCGKAFTQSSGLKVHMQRHPGDLPFECETCGKAFSESGHLIRHCNKAHA